MSPCYRITIDNGSHNDISTLLLLSSIHTPPAHLFICPCGKIYVLESRSALTGIEHPDVISYISAVRRVSHGVLEAKEIAKSPVKNSNHLRLFCRLHGHESRGNFPVSRMPL